MLKRMLGGVNIKDKIQNGAIILDVRTTGEFHGGHVKGSKNIPLDRLLGKIHEIKRWDTPVVACCASGMRSGTAVSILKREGIEAYNGGGWSSVNRLVD